MAFNVPTSGQWIAFPTTIEKCVTIEWKEKFIDYSAVYYVTRCFWGYLEGQDVIPKGLEPTSAAKKASFSALWRLGVPEVGPAGTEKTLIVRGSTDLFIASEYYDDQYRDGAMSKYHILELQPTGVKWRIMKLNSAFQYGQDGEFKNLRRFLVYHPINPPAIFQHRFTGLKSGAFFKKVEVAFREIPPVVSDDAVEVISTITGLAGKLIEVIKATVGHYLHQFLDAEGLEDAANRWRVHMKTRNSKVEAANAKLKQLISVLERKSDSKDLATLIPDVGDLNLAILAEEDVYLLALQIVESIKATGANGIADKEVNKRWLSQIEALKNVVLEGHSPFPVENFKLSGDMWSDKIDDFIRDPEKRRLLTEAKVLVASALEMQNRIAHHGADQVVQVVTQMQAEINHVEDTREELKRIVDAKALRRPKSDDNLNLAKSTARADQTRSQVQKNAGLLEQDSKNIGRNFAPPKTGSVETKINPKSK